jgi:hypothetical protein
MNALNKVKSVRHLGDYRVRLVFRDGRAFDLDLRPICEGGPVFEPLRDIAFFARVSVADWGVIHWPNDADIDSDVLRYWCQLGRVATREETNAHFQSAPAAA